MAMAGLGRAGAAAAAVVSPVCAESFSTRGGGGGTDLMSRRGFSARCGTCNSGLQWRGAGLMRCAAAAQGNGAFASVDSEESSANLPGLNPSSGVDKAKGKLESLFYTDSGIPEEKIERPTGLPKGLRSIGNKPRCPQCEAKGAVQCATCSGSGLYVDAILESQGIIVKVRCLGCGGAGNHMCLQCGGRGHI